MCPILYFPNELIGGLLADRDHGLVAKGRMGCEFLCELHRKTNTSSVFLKEKVMACPPALTVHSSCLSCFNL